MGTNNKWYRIVGFVVYTFPPKYVLGNIKYGIDCVFWIGWLLCPSFQTHHTSACNFILFGGIIIDIDMEVNWTFHICCSMMCTLVFVEQNKLVCPCNKYGCQWDSSYGSMCANGHQFQTPFIWYLNCISSNDGVDDLSYGHWLALITPKILCSMKILLLNIG